MRLFQLIGEILQNHLLVIALDWKRLSENGFQPAPLPLRRRDVFLKEIIVACSLYRYQVRDSNGIVYFAKITNDLARTVLTHCSSPALNAQNHFIGGAVLHGSNLCLSQGRHGPPRPSLR